MPQKVFAADLGGTKLCAAVVDARGRILARRTEPVDTSSTLAPVAQICRAAGALAAAGRMRLKFAAAGVAIPGLVRPAGTVWAPNLPGWERVPLARLLKQRLRIPVIVESDRNAAVIGEAWRGAARGKSDVVALLVGTGIGAGILSGGAVLRGAHELSGCAGWMVVSEEKDEESRRVGSLEALTAGPGIVRAAWRVWGAEIASALGTRFAEEITAQNVAEAARRGNAAAKQIFARVGRLLGYAVANLISVLDPEVVVLGGGLAGAADLFLDELKHAAYERCQPLLAGKVPIQVSRLGGDAHLLGAARLAWDAARTRQKRTPFHKGAT